jgi:hypothetical protein
LTRYSFSWALSFMGFTPFARQLRVSGLGAPRDLMILSFDNQRANSEKANASKIRINDRKR